VVEAVFSKNDDFGVAAVMIGMTGRALVIARVRVPAVIPGGRTEVRGDVLVTIHAKLPLRILVKHLMARGTLRLELSVTSDDVARHDERLDVLSMCSVRCKNSNRHR
jgi:hypothetical protein